MRDHCGLNLKARPLNLTERQVTPTPEQMTLLNTEIETARQLTNGSVYMLRKYWRGSGLLDAPVEVNGRLFYTNDQIRDARDKALNRQRNLAKVRPPALKAGESL